MVKQELPFIMVTHMLFGKKDVAKKNHEHIRYVLSKGKASFEALTQERVTILTNHINSVKRDSLNKRRSFELSQLLQDNKIREVLHLTGIKPGEINRTPELLK